MNYLEYEKELQEPYKYNPIDISVGFYALCSYQYQAWDVVFQKIREHYPDAPIVLINDGMDQYDYSEMAKKYNCIYIKKDRRICLHFLDLSYVHEFLLRTKESCDLVNTEWIIQLHPDVICQGKICYYPRSDICGVAAGSSNGISNNNWDINNEIKKVSIYIRKFYPNLELNGWGWCGGSIMKISSFNKVYDSIYKTNILSLDNLKNNMPSFVFKHEDTLMPVLFALNGMPYRIWKDNPEHHRSFKEGAFLHGYKDHYNLNEYNEYLNRSKNN